MPCPVRVGQSYYVDKPGMVITHLPPPLVGSIDDGKGTGSSSREAQTGGGSGVLLTGIMTHSKDKSMNGIVSFLAFTLDRPAVVRSRLS